MERYVSVGHEGRYNGNIDAETYPTTARTTAKLAHIEPTRVLQTLAGILHQGGSARTIKRALV